MSTVTDFGGLGNEFQKKLISQIIIERDFGLNVIEIMEPKYFDNIYCKRMVSMIKDYNQKHANQLPTLNGLKEKVLNEISDEIEKRQIVEIIASLPKISLLDPDQTREMALEFCVQKEFEKVIKKATALLKKGETGTMNQIVPMFEHALSLGNREKNVHSVNEDIDDALEEDYRAPIPTGVHGLDNQIGGGLGKGELGIVICPTGVGKTTFLSKIASTAYSKGFNVLQIFFEDKVKDIKRKHYSALTNFALDELHNYKDIVKEKISSCDDEGGRIDLKKYPSDSTTVRDIRNFITFMKNQGVHYDMVIVDYVDCLVTGKSQNDELEGEGVVIRQLETLCGEENIVLWSAVQSNRSGAGAETVELNMIQGSFKRAQVGHLIISIAKTQQQKALGLGTMSVLKSRFGGDGVDFKNMTFDNKYMLFDTTEQTIIGSMDFDNAKKEQDAQHQKRAIEALERAKENKMKKRIFEDSQKQDMALNGG